MKDFTTAFSVGQTPAEVFEAITDVRGWWSGQIDGETEVRFTHRGLIPQLECFGAWSGAWGSYVNGSLRSLITTGQGYPSPASGDYPLTGRP